MSCYQCSSNASLADCIEKQKVVNCTSPRDYCYKRKNETIGIKNEEVVVFDKGCTSAAQCRQNEKNYMECCKDKLCNKGKLTLATPQCRIDIVI